MRASAYLKGNYADRFPFGGEGVFLKGNLHTHTTVTDGPLDPEETIRRYKAAGYDFLSLTDHFIYTALPDQGGLTLLPGVEINYDDKDHYLFDHLVAIGDQNGGFAHGEEVKPVPDSSGWGVQRMINLLHETGHFVIYAHPHWSHRDAAHIAALHGIDAMEIYNTCCDVRFACGYSDQIYDDVLMRGQNPFALCTDDTHTPECIGGGWVCVKARENSRAAILEALRAGRFYASNGPQIFDYSLKDGVVSIDCSPVQSVAFVTYDHWGRTTRGENLTHAEFKLRGDETFLRIQIRDEKGNFAYTQPMFFF